MKRTFPLLAAAGVLALTGLAFEAPARAQYRQAIAHDPGRCSPGKGPAVLVTIHGISESRGTLRVQSYRGTKQDWLEDGRWLNRMDLPARAGTMRVCMPFPAPGRYAIAVRHDVNGNDETDITVDGGAMSNNPSINIFNLGRPSYRKTAFDVGSGLGFITLNMRYL